MAGVTLDKLPPALALNGGELFWLYQPGPNEVTPWIGVSCTTSLLADFLSGTGTPATLTTMRQLIAAMASTSVLVGVFEMLPSDITNSFNIAWNHASRMTISDPFITGFLQPTLGYSDFQMAELFVLASTFPA